MTRCSNCGQDSSTNINFCIKCGATFGTSSPQNTGGRPVISMDPNKQVPSSDNSSQYSYQNQNPQAPAYQPSAIPRQHGKSGQKNKVAIGAVGVLVAVVILFLIIGRKNTTDSNVTPSVEPSGSNYSPVVTDSAQYYSNYDDYPMEFRNAFLDSCNTDGNYEQCLCVLETMEESYTVEEVLYLQDLGDTSYLESAVDYCI